MVLESGGYKERGRRHMDATPADCVTNQDYEDRPRPLTTLTLGAAR